MALRKIVLLAIITFVFGCKGDNDDIIEDNDITNIDLSEGIIFGTINPTSGENFVYKYSDKGLFLVTNSGAINASPMVWETGDCPYEEVSLAVERASGVPNVARGIRDIPSTDILETFNGTQLQFYVLEYTTSGITKTIQFDDGDNFNEEQIQEYFNYIKTTTTLIEASGDLPQTSCEIDVEEETEDVM